MEDRLWNAAAPLRESGIPVVRLYEGAKRGSRASRRDLLASDGAASSLTRSTAA
jgi:hypothetical protein